MHQTRLMYSNPINSFENPRDLIYFENFPDLHTSTAIPNALFVVINMLSVRSSMTGGDEALRIVTTHHEAEVIMRFRNDSVEVFDEWLNVQTWDFTS